MEALMIDICDEHCRCDECCHASPTIHPSSVFDVMHDARLGLLDKICKIVVILNKQDMYGLVW